jgi:hypothetical protein
MKEEVKLLTVPDPNISKIIEFFGLDINVVKSVDIHIEIGKPVTLMVYQYTNPQNDIQLELKKND